MAERKVRLRSGDGKRKRDLKPIPSERKVVKMEVPPNPFESGKPPILNIFPSYLPSFDKLGTVEKELQRMGWGRLVELPWDCNCSSILQELAWAGMNKKKVARSNWRCNRALWQLEDFRRIFQMPEGGESLKGRKKKKWAEYAPFFKGKHTDKGGWKVNDLEDEKLRTVVAFVKPFLQVFQPWRIFVKEASAIIDAYEWEEEIDWAPALFELMCAEVDLPDVKIPIHLASLILHFYEGMNCLTEDEAKLLKQRKRDFVLEDPVDSAFNDGIELSSTEESSGSEKPARKRRAVTEASPVDRKGKKLAKTTSIIDVDDDDIEEVGRTVGGSRFQSPSLPFEKVNRSLFRASKGQKLRRSTLEQKESIVKYMDEQLAFETVIGQCLTVTGVETGEDLLEWVQQAVKREEALDEVTSLKKIVGQQSDLISSLKKKIEASDGILLPQFGVKAREMGETVACLKTLIEWRESFNDELRQRLKDESKGEAPLSVPVADKSLLRAMTAAWNQVMDELEGYVLRFEGCVTQLESMKEVVESFLNYYKTFDDALKVEFAQRGPDDAWHEVQAVGSPNKMVFPKGILKKAVGFSQPQISFLNPSLSFPASSSKSVETMGSLPATIVLPGPSTIVPKVDSLDSAAAAGVSAASSSLAVVPYMASIQDLEEKAKSSSAGEALPAVGTEGPKDVVDLSQLG